MCQTNKEMGSHIEIGRWPTVIFTPAVKAYVMCLSGELASTTRQGLLACRVCHTLSDHRMPFVVDDG